jgi:hypothetical protein
MERYLIAYSGTFFVCLLIANLFIAGMSGDDKRETAEGKKAFSISYAWGAFIRATGFELLILSLLSALYYFSNFSVAGSNGTTANLDLMNQRVCGCVVSGCGMICGAVLMCYPKKGG